MSELVWGIKNGDLDQVKDIIEKKQIDVNKEIDGRPPIHYAADYGQGEVISYLVTKGADVNAKDKHGISALLAAIWEGHTDCVRLLLEKGASKEGTAPDGTTYLASAEKDEIKQLLQK
ncbi:myotrophin [Schistocerca americana]|uniref:myotrophin n=1 Tax=Schistocerca americana TaxID=7009 RepID=UPI001F50079E|nr:myotrophin [Schistocerca americana]XP_047097342.1 myotrophin [Schistocerca piceifrons]XP_049767666.1 myotrophin [Schistocerca cancellata]XP_049793266.1 myotrophin [Schistocerca nitens]XP_049839194.1 myotrophin [Schistocerca gregaria]XP_049941494.1 myotrophin [Schistocerca serialis cubense]